MDDYNHDSKADIVEQIDFGKDAHAQGNILKIFFNAYKNSS